MPVFSSEGFFDSIHTSFSHYPNPGTYRDPKPGQYSKSIPPESEGVAANLAALYDMGLSPYGLVFVDCDLKILEANDRAKSYLKAGQGIGGRAGKLHLDRAGAMRRIHEAVGRLLAPSGSPNAAIVGVPDGEGRIRYAIRIAAAQELVGAKFALLVVAELIVGEDISRAELLSVFNLSEREAELAEYFSKDMRLEQIAPIMGVSLNTARMHLRRVFNKTGCSTQAGLARMIAHFPTTFARNQFTP
jgi:DNA-binding CsgD family transcriptional regulator